MEMFWEMLVDIYTLPWQQKAYYHGWAEDVFVWSIWVIFVFVAVVVVGLLVYGVIYAIDNTAMPRRTGTGVVADKEYTPLRLQPMLVGKSIILQPIPESYDLFIEIPEDGHLKTFPVSRCLYQKYHTGDRVETTYVVGRLTGRVYLKTIAKM